MPIIDSLLLLSDAQAVTATAASTNVIDFGAPGTPKYSSVALVRDKGKSYIPITAVVTEDFATLTSLTLSIETSADNSTYTTAVSTGVIAAASLKAGYRFSIDKVPVGSTARYMRAYFTAAGSNATAGKVTVAIGACGQTNINGG